MGLLERLGIRAPVARATPGTSVLFPADGGQRSNWFQLGTTPASRKTALTSSAVYACVAVISQEVARLKVHHWRDTPDGGRVKVKTSPAARVMRRINNYQTPSDFWLNYIAACCLSGNAYAVAERDAVGRIVALHPIASTGSSAQVDPATGAVFYDVSAPRVAPQVPSVVPARDVAHLKLFTGADPLVGISPLEAASYSMAHAEQIQRQAVSFWGNKAQPSGILSTDRPLSVDAARRLRDQWQNANSSDNAGKTAVLDSGMTWTPLSITARDSEMIASYNLSTDTIASIFRVPLYMLGRSDPTFSNVENLSRQFYVSTLASWLEATEAVLDKLFQLPPGESIEFDVERGLMQSNFDQRMKAFRDGIQGGILSPNEARAFEKLPAVPGGDRVFLQAQMESVETRAEAPTAADPAPAPAPAPAEPEPDESAERIAELERTLATQRLEFAHEAGSLRQDLALAQSRAEGVTHGAS
jgi:HK97 family phage portal protein